MLLHSPPLPRRLIVNTELIKLKRAIHTTEFVTRSQRLSVNCRQCYLPPFITLLLYYVVSVYVSELLKLSELADKELSMVLWHNLSQQRSTSNRATTRDEA